MRLDQGIPRFAEMSANNEVLAKTVVAGNIEPLGTVFVPLEILAGWDLSGVVLMAAPSITLSTQKSR